jgi:lactose/L-arabinose transport system permease protein
VTRFHKGTIFKYVFLTAASLVSIFPLVWMLMSATNRSVDIIGGRLVFGTSLFANFAKLLEVTQIGTALWNSFRNAAALTLASLVVCSAAGYAFELYHDRWKDKLMGVLLLSMMVPFAATLIPLFKLFGRMNLINSTLGFMLPTISTAFMIFLFRQSARNFPYDIVEAARIEGFGEFRIFAQIFIPVMKATYAAATTVTFMNAWNSYMWPLVIMQKPESRTMPLLVSNLIAGYTIDYGVLMLAVSISTLPTIIMFFVLQRYFAEGITGAVK